MIREHILVTGGAGYIGSILVPELLAGGYRVTVLDSFMYRQASLGHVCSEPGLEIVRGDVRVASDVRPLLARADVVIPLAAIVGAPACARDPVGAESINLRAPLDLFEWSSKGQLILMPTTNSAYGSCAPGTVCDEQSPLRPLSLYAKHKHEVELALLARGNAVSFRLATVFGMSPRMRLDLLVNDFTYRAVNDRSLVLFEAHFRRNYVHVRDVAAAFLWALERRGQMAGEVYNVGLSSANLTKLELAQAIRAHVPELTILEAPLARDPDQRDYVVSNAKLEATGWRPSYSLDDGIRELVKGFAMVRNSSYSNV